jgi:small subunit ribosomal protein S6
VLHEYETMIVIRPDLDDAVTSGIVEKLEAVITEKSGTILIRDDWGKRKLNYPIAKNQKGHYVLLNYLVKPAEVAELERKIRIDDNVVRFLTIKIAEAVDVPTRIEQAAEQRRQREIEAKARAEAEAREAELDRDEDEDEPVYS